MILKIFKNFLIKVLNNFKLWKFFLLIQIVFNLIHLKLFF